MVDPSRPASSIPAGASLSGFLPVLEASPNAIVAVDDEGRIAYANRQGIATFGYEPDELLGQPIEILLPSEARERHTRHRAGYTAAPGARPMGIGLDLAARRRDGTTMAVEISLAPVEMADGGRLVFATVVDISGRKSLEGQLQQAEKLNTIGRLAGGIAHDFNNMLSAMRGYADLIVATLPATPGGPVDVDDLRGSALSIVGAADRAAQLTAQLLAFARQQVLQPRVLELGEAVRAIVPLAGRLVDERIRLVVRTADDTGRIRMDSSQLDQIIVNLVVNAKDALPTGGTVTIETQNVRIDDAYAADHFEVHPGEYVLLTVSDDGIGMDAETKRHIFEPFFTTKAIGQGTGLGLSTIYGTVRQSGGHIWLYSEPGMGTTFKLFFPRIDGPADDGPAASADRGRPVPGGRVLVVEDEVFVRDLLVAVLRRAGYEVDSAPDGRAALARIEGGERYAAIVSDVVMPMGSGTELARVALERAPATGVVLLSGYTVETLDLTALLARGVVFVDKPFATERLLAAVASVIRRPA